MSEKKLFLLDAYALIFRAYYAFIKNPRITSYGLNTNAIFGFTNTLIDVLGNQKPSHIAVVFDHKSKTLRAQEHEFYKANRDETPEDIKLAEPFIRKIISAFQIPIYEAEGYEADDIIGTLAKKAEKKGFTTYMMTPDKDFGQLVSENIFMLRPGRQGNDHEIWGKEEIQKKFNLNHPKQVIDFLGLMGDSVDNIPGVPGIGPKTASKLLLEFGDIDGIYKNINQLKGKVKERLEENIESAAISKKLATIVLDVPISFDSGKMMVREPNKLELSQIFSELEFRNLSRRILGPEPPKAKTTQGNLFDQPQVSIDTTNPEDKTEAKPEFLTIQSVKHDYQLIQTKEQRQKIITELLSCSLFSFDTETDSLNPLEANLLGISFSSNKSTGYYQAMPADFEQCKNILNDFKPLLEHKKIKKVAQNIKYDWMVLLKYDIHIQSPFEDTMLAHYILDADSKHNLNFLAEQYLNYQPISIASLIGKKGKNQLNFNSVPLDKAMEYAVEDADITLQIFHNIQNDLQKQDKNEVYKKIEIPLVEVLVDMEKEGVNIDANFLNKYAQTLQNESINLEKKVFDKAEVEFNLASPKQLGEVLFDKLKLDSKAKKTKTGQYKTDEETLQKLALQHELPQIILEYRQIQKLRSTYVEALPQLINVQTGRVHTSFAQAVAATGRLSSNHPNLQNIPIRTERGRQVRKAFIPRDKNHVLMASDYSQIELRIVASISNDEAMKEAFQKGMDIHTATAARVFGVNYKQVDQEMRRKAKTVNFGIIYGITAFGLSQRVGIPRKEAAQIIDEYFNQFSGIKKYMENSIQLCRENGFVSTISGRKRYIKDINSQNRTVVGFAERNAINAPIQGSAADMIKIAMVSVYKRLKEEEMKTKMILQVHDELLFDTPKNEIDQAKEIIEFEMENAMKLNVPIVVESGVGQNWLEAH